MHLHTRMDPNINEHDFNFELNKDGAPDDWNADGYWGKCPTCDGNDGLLNIGRVHWFRCDLHRVMWSPGENLFSYWRQEPEELHRQNAERLADYVVIEFDDAYRTPPGHADSSL